MNYWMIALTLLLVILTSPVSAQWRENREGDSLLRDPGYGDTRGRSLMNPPAYTPPAEREPYSPRTYGGFDRAPMPPTYTPYQPPTYQPHGGRSR